MDGGIHVRANTRPPTDSAALLFDLQPVIVAHGDLLARVLGLFERCGAVQLRQRLFFAAGRPSRPLH